MHNSYSLSKRLVLVLFLAVVATQLFLIRNVSSLNLTNAYLHHKCLISQGKYKPGSQYEKNLNSHIDLIINSTFRNGFGHMTTAMGSPNMVNIIFQCRGDSYQSKCRSCFAAGISGEMSLIFIQYPSYIICKVIFEQNVYFDNFGGISKIWH